MKQTAVEWLEKEIFRNYKFLLQKVDCTRLEESIEQAKEMEKEQQGYSEEDMKRAFCNGGQLDYSALTSTEFGTKILNKWLEDFKKK
jgi:hypothetical protein